MAFTVKAQWRVFTYWAAVLWQDENLQAHTPIKTFASSQRWQQPFSEDLWAYFSFFGGFFGGFFLTIHRKIDFFAFFGGFIRSDFIIIYIYITWIGEEIEWIPHFSRVWSDKRRVVFCAWKSSEKGKKVQKVNNHWKKSSEKASAYLRKSPFCAGLLFSLPERPCWAGRIVVK